MSTIVADSIEPRTSGGVIDVTPCTFRMFNSQAVAQASATTVSITYDTVEWDTHSITDLSNNRVVITSATAGYWWISSKFSMDNSVPYRLISWIYIGKPDGSSTNTIQHEMANYSQTTGAYPSVQAHGIVKLVSGDRILPYGYHGQGSTKNRQGGRNTNGLEGYRIGPA
tara:strand:- start:49 stop:555 length:507 start_codon:yes stop_codon:yes gene_type:complete